MPEFAEAGYTAIWVPPITKSSSVYSTGYDCFNGFDLGDLNENGTIPTRYGTKEELQNMVLTAHRFGIRVYVDSVINHRSFQVPGYDQYTSTTVFSGLLPEDFHLWETPDGFFRQVSQSNFNTTFETEYHGFSGLTDLSEENPNGYFGPGAENDAATAVPKLVYVRQPNDPQYYPDQNLPPIMGMTAAGVVTNTYWHPFNGTNGTPNAEDTASYLIRAAMYQMQQTMCDGYRVDAIKHVPSVFYGDYTTSQTSGYTTWYGFTGGLQTIFDYIHGYGYNNPISGYNNTQGNRASCYDTEAIRNDAMIFGEDLGDGGAESYDSYFYRGARLEDIQLHNKLYVPVSSLLASGGSLAGFEQVTPTWGTCDFPAYDDNCDFDQNHREMFVGTHDGGVSGTQNRTIVMPYVFMREGLPSLYSDGFNHAAFCGSCGDQAFPAVTYSQYLGEGTNVNPHTGGYSDEYNLPDEMPEVAYLHGQEARGGTQGLWSDANVVAFARYDYREVSSTNAYNDPDADVSIFIMNDKPYPGDVEFNDIGTNTPPPGANSVRQALSVPFAPGSVLYNLATAGPGYSRTLNPVTVLFATNSTNYNSSTTAYVGSQALWPGGGAIRIVVPAQTYGANGVASGYLIYAYQGPQASYAGLQDAITIQQNGQTVPSMTVYRQDGPNGDPQFNPIYPYERRGRVDQTGAVIGGQNFSNLTYSIDIPVVTNNTPMTFTLRTDASANNMIVKLDGGMDLNSQMGFGPIWTNSSTGFIDARDCRPGYTNDMFVGYEQALFQFRYGPEKFGAANTARNIVVSLGAETYSYTVGSRAAVFGQGSGTNTATSTASWVFHDPNATTDVAGVSMLMPTNTPAGQPETIWVKVGYDGPAYVGNIYYTTYDGGPVTNFPEGSFGVPKTGTFTQMAPLTLDHTSTGNDGTYDWFKGTITNPASGPVFYKVAIYEKGIAPISDGDQSKYYGLTQFAITNFNPQTALVWLHNDLNTNNTAVGLSPGYHMLRLRALLSRPGKSSVFNTFMQTFFYDGPQTGPYDTQPAQGVIAFPAQDGSTIGGSSYGVVVRADPSVTEVDYNIVDAETNNDDGVTGQLNGNGYNSNNVPSWAVATQESPDPTIGAAYPGLPEEFRFNYVAIPSSSNATIYVRLKQAVNSTFTNQYTTLTRQVVCAGNTESLIVAFPTPGQQITLGQSTPYTNVFCACGLSQNLSDYTLTIDGIVQPQSSIFFQGNYCNCYNGTPDLRFGWSGMSPGTHTIQISYDDGLVKEYYSNIVTVQIDGVYASVVSPPPANPLTGASPDTIVVNTCTGGAPLTKTNYTIVVNTTNTVNTVQVSFSPSTNIFAGGSAVKNGSFTGSATNDTLGLDQWTFPWTNVIAGTWTVQVTAVASGSGTNVVSQPVIFSFRQIDLAGGTNTDDSDNDGISDYLETNNIALPSGDPGLWKNSDVHVAFFSGKTNPLMADTDGDGLPDGLELGIGTVPAANDTVLGVDPYCGQTNFIPDLDPPLYNTEDNSTAPAGYDGYNPWPYNINNSHSDQIAGTVTDPNNPDTDGDGLMDGIEDMNHNGRVDITLTNSAGLPLTSTNGVVGLTYLYPWTNIVVIAHPPTFYNTSIIDRAQVLRVWPNALWLETDPNNSDTDGDGIPDGEENASHTGYMAIGLLNHNIGYNAGSCSGFAATNCVLIVTNAESPNASCGCVTNILPIPLPSSILYAPGTSRVNRKALIKQFPNAVLLETDPMDAHTDGDPNGLSDGWKVQYGLDPWDDGVIGHTNWHTGALIITTRNGENGDPAGDGISNLTKYENGLNPNDYYTSNVPAVTESIPLNDGPTIGTTAGETWQEEFEGWSVNDLKVVRPYDGIGPNYEGQTVFPLYDGYDYSRDIIAFYAHDGGETNEGGDGNYYFRIDLHDLSPSAESSGRVSFYVAINVGLPGTGQTVFPENIGATSDMGWHVLVGIYGDGYSGSPTAFVYTASLGTNSPIAFGKPGGVQTLPHWRGDLSSVVFAIPRQTLLSQGWSGITPLSLQVFDTGGGVSGTPSGDPTAITDSIYDNSITQSSGNTYGTALHYWFTTVNANAINLSAYDANASILSQTNRPYVAKVAIVLDANQSLIPATMIQNLISNNVSLTATGLTAAGGEDPGGNPTGYYRALESAQVFGVPLNLHLNGALISALQWAHSNPALDPSGSRDGAAFNQRIASMVANGQASLISGMYGSHMAPYFTGSVNRAGIQLQDDIMRTVYGNNSVSANTPVFLPERAADGPTMSDLAANSGHNYTILDQTTHLWWWADEIEGPYSDQPAATGDNGYTINTFNGMKAFLISDLYSDLIYSNDNLGAYDTLREVLIQKALDSNYGQVVVLEDQWENAAGLTGNTANPDLLNLTIRWLANHQWIKVVRLDQLAAGAYDINNDGVTNGSDVPAAVTLTNATFNYSIEANDFILHSCETNLNNWYYGNSQYESFYNRYPILRGDDSNTMIRTSGNESYANTNTDVMGGKMLGGVQSGGNGTVLYDTWADVQTLVNSAQAASQTNLDKLAQLVYLSGLFETGFHDVYNFNDIRYSTGNYIYPETVTDLLAQFALKGAARATRQADIVAYATAWAVSNPSSNTVTTVFDAEQSGDPQHNYVISNNRVYAVFERIGGRLVAAFARDPNTGSAYEIIGSLASTPEYESEREGVTDGTGAGPLAYRASGFKDWYAVTNASGAGITQYVNDYYTVAPAAVGTGWQFTSQDGHISKTITLAPGATKLEAKYVLSGGVKSLYIRHGFSPDLLNLLYQGQGNLHGPNTNVTGQVNLENFSSTCVAMDAVDYADIAAHSNTQYNATADDTNGVGGVQYPMRDLAETAQVQLLGSNSFSFALDLEALQGDAAPNGDGISNYQATQLGANPFSPWDTNGLTTAWEMKYFGKTNINANADSDGNGLSNYQDFMAGLNPTNPASLFRVLSVVPVSNGYQITWTSVAGKNYQVEAATSLSSANYTPVGGIITASGTITTFVDTTAAGAPRFYRVQVVYVPPS